jgi:4-amino-4-deoxy-L-arabinose transferase-like glycosyltransferase
MPSTRSRTKLWSCTYAIIAVFAFAFVWVVGHRGLMVLDQSALFDSAWRMYDGQVLYRDYLIPRPPVTIFIQWLFFRLWGVNFSAMVLPAAVLNALAVLCVIWLVRRMFPSQHFPACAAGLLTAVWFQAPFGTLWFEQTAFFFNLGALLLLLKAPPYNSSSAILLRATAGCFIGLAILSKQNAGLEFLPVALGVIAIQTLPRLREVAFQSIHFLAGIAIVALVFIFWVWTFSSPSGFWYCLVQLPREIAADRINFGDAVLGFLILMAGPRSIVELALLSVALWKLPTRRASVPAASLITFIVLGCISFQNLFQLHTMNEHQNSLPYRGLIFGLSLGFLLQLVSRKKDALISSTDDRRTFALYASIGVLIFGFAFTNGVTSSWSRKVQQFDRNTRFVPLELRGAERLKWGEPTPATFANTAFISAKEFTELNIWLSKANTNFFVFPDSTILYGLQRRVSPQPWVFFLEGHSFLYGELPRVDAIVVESLRKNKVGVVILEREAFLGNQKLFDNMPKFRSLVREEFEKVQQFGIYEVWRLRPEIKPAADEKGEHRKSAIPGAETGFQFSPPRMGKRGLEASKRETSREEIAKWHRWSDLLSTIPETLSQRRFCPSGTEAMAERRSPKTTGPRVEIPISEHPGQTPRGEGSGTPIGTMPFAAARSSRSLRLAVLSCLPPE